MAETLLTTPDAPETTTMSAAEVETAVRKGDITRQWEWHETFRDTAKNMYRTTYNDMIHGREVAVKSDFPSGYGGHVPTVAHDILFQNTGLYATLKGQGEDRNRDCFPSFAAQKSGAAVCEKAEAAANEDVPTYGALPDVRVQPPWAITPPIREVPSYKSVPRMDVKDL